MPVSVLWDDFCQFMQVIIFGENNPVEDLAAALGTIPYEVFTGISERVKRVYFEE